MTDGQKAAAQELVDAHWAYIEDLLEVEGKTTSYIEIVGFHYRTAMMHGIKHGIEMAIEMLKEDQR